jgi:hypothetical protein
MFADIALIMNNAAVGAQIANKFSQMLTNRTVSFVLVNILTIN